MARTYRGIDPAMFDDPRLREALSEIDRTLKNLNLRASGGDSTLPTVNENDTFNLPDDAVPIAGAEAVPGTAHILRTNASGELMVELTTAPTITITEPISVDDNGGSLTVDDGGSSLTVDGTVTVTEPVSVDDNGGSLTVDGAVTVSGSVTADTELPAAAALGDADANPTAPQVGACLQGWNGGAWYRAGGSAANGIEVDVTRLNDGGNTISIDDGAGSITVDGSVTVSGTVSVTEPVSVDDNGGSLTVDGTVTIQDGGNVISVDDGAGSLTVDGSVTVSDGGGSITVDGTVTADTELPAAAGLADTVANPTTSVVASYNVARDEGTTTYSRVSGELSSVDTEAGNDGDFAMHVSDVVKNYYLTPTTIDDTYDGTPSTNDSGAIDVRRFREGLYCFTLDSTGTPTDFTIEILFSETSGGTYYTYCRGEWCNMVFDDVICATAINRCYGFKVCGNYMKIRVTGTGLAAGSYFVLSNSRLVLKT